MLTRKFVAVAASLVTAFTLIGCVSAPSTEPSEPGTVEMDRDKLPPAPTAEPPPRSPSSRAVAGLVSDSRREYEQGDWEAAIATAERALRIDRRQPDVYLIIAKSYRALGEPRQALQFVQQGLRYVVDDTSDVARELNWLDQALR